MGLGAKFGAAAYSRVDHESRAAGYGQHELVSMLYEGLLDRVQQAKGFMATQAVELKIKKIDQAIEILNEGLRAHLDMKGGGSLAYNLDQLYAYCSVRLVKANLKNDVAGLDEVHTLLAPVVDAWKQIKPSSANSGLDLYAAAVRQSANKTASKSNVYAFHQIALARD
jgi:flagellar protein FliS